MSKIATSLILLALMTAWPGCENPDPTCAPGEVAYRFCSDDVVWQCPQGTPAQIADRKRKEEQCKQASDPVKCLLELELEMVPTVKITECGPAGMRCADDPFSTPRGASCQSDSDGGGG